MNPDTTIAARNLLLAHDNLRRTDAHEPALNSEGLPHNPTAWLDWHDTRYRPAFKRFTAALDTFRAVTGWNIGGHPSTFRPLCEALTAGKSVADVSANLHDLDGQLFWATSDE